MRPEQDVIVTYMMTLENAKMTSVRKAMLCEYMKSIGIDGFENAINALIKNKTLICLSSGRVTLNKVKLKKDNNNRLR
jgi:hypothetical protein